LKHCNTLKAGINICLTIAILSIIWALKNGCVAAPMPSELRGKYTFGPGEQCGYLTIEASRFWTEEDLSCTASTVKRRESISPSSFEMDLICQVDDPKPVRIKGLFDYVQLRNSFVLVMRLSIPRAERRRVSMPSSQLFAKCE
jgi:hypothetical protein